jgi:5-methylcytosine-specific restriction protein A
MVGRFALGGNVSRWKHERQSSTARGYGAEWQRLRTVAMERDGYLCQPCKRKGKDTPAREVDHITPKAEGGTDSLDNLQAICIPCHKDKTQQEAARARGATHRPARIVGVDGYPIE